MENFIKKEKSLKKRIKYLLENEILSDFKCLVGKDGPEQKSVPCHKFVFAITSYEFYNLFHTLKSNETVIKLPEICYTSFKQFVRYVYTEEIALNDKNIIEIWLLARRFQIEHLTDFCCNETRRILQKSKDADLINQILKIPFIFRSIDKFLLNEIIGINPLKYLNAKTIGVLKKTDLEIILKTSKSDAKETDFFQIAILWARFNIPNKFLTDVSLGVKMRSQFPDLIKLIRFPIMRYEEFHACLKDYDGLLSSEEIFQIIFYITEKKELTVFPTEKRNGIKEVKPKEKSQKSEKSEKSPSKPKSIKSTESVEIKPGTSNPFVVEKPLRILFIGSRNNNRENLNYGNHDNLSIQSDKMIKLHGIGVQFGLNLLMIDQAQIELCLRDRFNIKIVNTFKTIDLKRSFPEDQIIRNDKYFLDYPVILQPNVLYEFSAEIITTKSNQYLNIGVGIPNVSLGVPYFDDGVQIRLNELKPNYFITEILFEKFG